MRKLDIFKKSHKNEKKNIMPLATVQKSEHSKVRFSYKFATAKFWNQQNLDDEKNMIRILRWISFLKQKVSKETCLWHLDDQTRWLSKNGKRLIAYWKKVIAANAFSFFRPSGAQNYLKSFRQKSQFWPRWATSGNYSREKVARSTFKKVTRVWISVNFSKR